MFGLVNSTAPLRDAIGGSIFFSLLLSSVLIGFTLPVANATAADTSGVDVSGANESEAKAENENSALALQLTDGLLTVDIRNVPLPEVLSRLGKLSGFKVVRIADFNDFPKISAKFKDLPLQQGVERLVSNANRIFFYAENEGSSERELSQLWLLGPGEASVRPIQNVKLINELQDREPIKRSLAALRLAQDPEQAPVFENLALLLHTDPDPLVRARVAIALGKLGDDRAVAILEAALLDQNFSVRTQSMGALGQIGGERATDILGNVLTNQTVGSLERVMAAKALWKQNTEIALGYLQASINDTNQQVRDAARTPPVIATTRLSAAGPEDSQ